MDDPSEDIRARIRAQWRRDNRRALALVAGVLTGVSALAVAALICLG